MEMNRKGIGHQNNFLGGACKFMINFVTLVPPIVRSRLLSRT